MLLGGLLWIACVCHLFFCDYVFVACCVLMNRWLMLGVLLVVCRVACVGLMFVGCCLFDRLLSVLC